MNRLRSAGIRTHILAAVLASILVAAGLTAGIDSWLTKRTAASTETAALTRAADTLASLGRLDPNYIRRDYSVGSFRIITKPRTQLRSFVPHGIPMARPAQGTVMLHKSRYRFAYRPLPHLGLVVLEQTATATNWGALARDVGIASGFSLVIATLISLIVVRSMVRPIAVLSAATRGVDSASVPVSLPVGGPREIASLTQAFNAMAAGLAIARDSERAFLMSVSHELKTPLTAIAGFAEGLSDGVFSVEEASTAILREAGRLRRLISDLVGLARMRRTDFSVRADVVDLGDAIQEAVAACAPTAASHEIGVVTEVRDPAFIIGDRDRVVQVVVNLLDNAFRATPEKGTVTVSARGHRIEIGDHGPMLEDGDVSKAFEPFFLWDRYPRDRLLGSGLAVAVAFRLMALMGGALTLTRSTAGGLAIVASFRKAEQAMLPDARSPSISS